MPAKSGVYQVFVILSSQVMRFMECFGFSSVGVAGSTGSLEAIFLSVVISVASAAAIGETVVGD